MSSLQRNTIKISWASKYWVIGSILRVFAIVARDDVEVHFGKSDNGALPSPNVARREFGLDAYIWVNDLDALYAELQERGARILESPVLRVYKCYEMVVEDNFGFRLCFSMDTGLASS
jgi:hypothetical protein